MSATQRRSGPGGELAGDLIPARSAVRSPTVVVTKRRACTPCNPAAPHQPGHALLAHPALIVVGEFGMELGARRPRPTGDGSYESAR